MRSKERRSHLLQALQIGEVDVENLARLFGVSASTVRRDLQHLSEEKAVRRTYGGAILINRNLESTLGERLEMRGAEKRAIAQAALASIEDGDTIILDAGSTILALGQLLSGRKLRIVTNNLALIPLLVTEPDIEVIVLGGTLRASSMGTVGPLAMEALRRVTADKVFMSADGIVADRGLCEADLDQVSLKSLMMEQAREVVILADATKLGRAEHSAWAPLPSHWRLLTDASATNQQIAPFTAVGAKVTTVG